MVDSVTDLRYAECSRAPDYINVGCLGRWGTHACPQCLPSDTVPVRSWTRTPRRPGIRHRHLPCHWCAFTDLYHTMPYHAMPYRLINARNLDERCIVRYVKSKKMTWKRVFTTAQGDDPYLFSTAVELGRSATAAQVPLPVGRCGAGTHPPTPIGTASQDFEVHQQLETNGVHARLRPSIRHSKIAHHSFMAAQALPVRCVLFCAPHCDFDMEQTVPARHRTYPA